MHVTYHLHLYRALCIAILLIAGFFGAPWKAEATITALNGSCSAVSTTAGTSLACNPSAGADFDAGNTAIVFFAGDNTATADGNDGLLTGVTDTKNNTWTVEHCFTNSQGAAAAGATVCVAISQISTTIVGGVDSITASFSTITAKSFRAFEVGSTNGMLTLATTTERADDGTDTGALTFSGLTVDNYLFFRASAMERNTASWTSTPNYTDLTCANANTGTNATSMSVCGEYRIVTATSSTLSDPTLGTTPDNASVLLAFTEEPVITGTLYSDEGITALTGSAKTIKLAVGTGTPSVHSTTTVSGDGTFAFEVPVTVPANTPMVLWVDGDSATRGSVSLLATGQPITGLNLYQNRAIIREEVAGLITLSDIDFYDNDNDADIPYNASSTALVVGQNTKLYIWSDSSFTGAGTVHVSANASSTSSVDGSIHLASGSSFTTSGTTTIGGSLTASSSATYSVSPVTLFTATTTGKYVTTPISSLGDVIFNGSGGGWTMGTTSTTSDLTILAGTLTAPSTNLTITGDYTNSGTFTHNSGTTTFRGTTDQTATGTMTGTSSFHHLELTGWGTKTLGTNASTTGNFLVSGEQAVTGSITSLGTLGTANEYSATGDATLRLSLGLSSAEAGNLVILSIASDNINTTDGDLSEVASVTDTSSNTWTKLIEYTNGNGTAGAGATVSLWYSVITDTITGILGEYIDVTFSSAIDAKAMGAWEFGLSGELAIASTTYEVYDGVVANSMAISGLTSDEYLFLRAIAYEDRAQTLTPTANYTEFPSTEAVADGGGQNPSMTAMGEFRIVTGTGETSNPTVSGSGKDGSSVFAALNAIGKEATQVLMPAYTSVGGHYTNNDTTISYAGGVWQSASAAEANAWRDVTYGNNLFVAVADGGTNRVMTSADGVTWTPRQAATTSSWMGVAYGEGTFAAVACGKGTSSCNSTSGARVMTSADGVTWVGRSTTTIMLYDITYGDGRFVAVGMDGYSATSTDGMSWGSKQNEAGILWVDVAYGNGMFVAVGQSTSSVWTSPNGTSWTERAGVESANWNSVAYGNGMFVAVNSNGTNRIMTSPDGITWTARTAAVTAAWETITYANGFFLATAADGSLMTSPDGVSWVSQTAAEANSWSSGAHGSGTTVLVAYSGTNRVMVSRDSTTIFNGSSAQTVSGNLTATSSFRNVIFAGSGTKTFGANASTTNLTIRSDSGAVTAPSYLTIAGDYSNAGTFTHNSGTTTFTGTIPQTASGTMTGTSAFSTLIIENTRASTTFNAALTVSQRFLASSTDEIILEFSPGVTTTLTNAQVTGTSSEEIKLWSVSPGSQWLLDLDGTYRIAQINAKDSNACPTSGTKITSTNYVDGGNNDCWLYFFLISGTVYGDEGLSTLSSKTLGIAVGTTSASVHATTTTASGVWSYKFIEGHEINVNTPILVWFNDDASTKGAVLTKVHSTSSNITDLNLYQNRLILRHEGSTSTRSNDLTFYDADNDTDIPHFASSTQLVVKSGTTLYVWPGKTFNATGTVVVRGNASSSPLDGSLHIGEGSTYTSTGSTTLAGNFTASSSSSYTSTSTLVFNATTTGKIINTALSGLGTTTFDGVGGGWTFASTATTSNLTVTNGTVVGPSTELVITGNYTNSGTFTHNNGTTTFNSILNEQLATGTMTGTSAFKHLRFVGGGMKVIGTNASTTNFLIEAGATTTIIATTSISGTYTNNGSYVTAAHWTARSAAAAQTWRALTYGEGTFVAVGDTGAGGIMTSSDGVSWTTQTSPGGTWNDVAYGNGTFVAVADSGTYRAASSPDGVTWTGRTAPLSSWTDVTFGNGTFVAVGSAGAVMTSGDGLTWATGTSPVANNWVSVAYGDGLFVAVGGNGGNDIMTSPDGLTWTARATGNGKTFNAITYGNGTFLTTSADNGWEGGISSDGVNWSSLNLPGGGFNWQGVTYGNGLFVAFETSGNDFYISHDGRSWTGRTPPQANAWTDAAYGAGQFVVVSSGGTNRVMSSKESALVFNGSSAQTLSGNLTATSTLRRVVFTESGAKSFMSNASTTDLEATQSSGLVTLPTLLTISGDYTNNATVNHTNSTTTFAGNVPQTATGTMTGASAFASLVIRNSTASTTFSAPLTVSQRFIASAPGGTIAFASEATTTLTSATINGSSTAPLRLRSNTAGSRWLLDLDGTYSIAYVDVQDSNACPTSGSNITATNAQNSGNNQCWFNGLILSGTLYEDEGFTPYGTSQAIKIAIGTTTPSAHATTSLPSGAWNFSFEGTHTIATGTPILIWVDGNASARAAAFTKAAGSSDYSGLDLYLNRVIVRHAGSGTSTRLTDLTFYDGTDDTDIQFTTSDSALEVNTNNKLYIWPNTIFNASGTVTVHGNASSTSAYDGSLHIADGAQFITTGTTTIGGNLTVSSTAAFTATSSLVFSATTTGKTINAPDRTFSSLVFNGGGGGWSFAQGSATVTSLTNLAGSLTAPTSTLTILGDYTNYGTFVHNGGTVVFGSSTPTTTYTGSSFLATAGGADTNIVGVTYHDGYFYVVGRATDSVYKYTATGTYTGTSFGLAAYGNGAARGITYAQGHLWIVDANDFKVYKYRLNGEFASSTFALTAANANPRGITYGDGYFWITDTTDNAVYKYTLDGTYTGTSFSTAGSGMDIPSGIVYAHNSLWIVDDTSGPGGNDQQWLYRYRLSGTYTGTYHDLSTTQTGYGEDLAVANGYLWVLSGTNEQIYKYAFGQYISGTATGTSSFNNVRFENAAPKSFTANASTSNFTIAVNSGMVHAPPHLTISGNYSNSTSTGFWHSWSTTTMSSSSAQTISGIATGSSAFGSLVLTGAGTKAFPTRASTTNLFIDAASGNVTAPSVNFSVAGDFVNNGTYTSSGTTTFDGAVPQTATGTLSFATLIIDNAVATTTFGNGLTVSQRFLASSSADMALIFAAGTTTTLMNATLRGSSTNEIVLRSTVSGTQWDLDLNGTYSLTYLDVRDSNACPTSGTQITSSNIIDSGNNDCWAATLRLQGNLYGDEGNTPITSSKTLGIAIGTSTRSLHTTTSSANGSWYFTVPAGHSISSSTPILVWVDGEAATRAALLTKSNTANTSISNLDLYQNRVIVSHEAVTGTSTRVIDMEFYDRDNDADVAYTANAGVLTVHAGNQLFIWPGKTFTSTSTITINGNGSSTSYTDGSLHLGAGSTYTPGATTTLAGSFTASSSATFTPTTSPLVFTATTTGKVMNVVASTLGKIIFNGSGGGWTIGTTSTTSLFTISAGNVTAPSTTLTITSDYTNNGTFSHNNGTVIFASSSATTTYTGTRFDTAASGNGAPYDLVYANGYLWVTDTTDAEVYKYTLDGTYTGVSFDTAASGNGSPRGIAFDQNYFWVVDDVDDLVYQYTPDGASTALGFSTAGTGNDPRGITYINGSLWITDTVNDEAYQYSPYSGGSYTGVSFDTAASGNGDPRGLTYANGYIWIVDEIDARLYRYNLQGTYTNLSYSTAGSGNGAPDGITFGNGYFWTTDGTDTDIYKYSLGQMLEGASTGTSAFNNLIFRGEAPKNFSGTALAGYASTSSFTIEERSGTVNVPAYLSISGSYSNSTTSGYWHNWGTTTFDGTSSQTISGHATGTSAFNHVVFKGGGTKTLPSNASTSNFFIDASSGAVTAPSNILSLEGHYTNNSTFVHNNGTTTFIAPLGQTATGTMTGSSALNNVVFFDRNSLTNGDRVTFGANASTSGFRIDSGAWVNAPQLLSIGGNYANLGEFNAGTGTTTLNGTAVQALSGQMTGTDAFHNLAITNTSGAGSSSQSVRFTSSASSTGTFTMVASTSVQFAAGATTTIVDLSLRGEAGRYAWLRSSVPGNPWKLNVSGVQRYVTYVNAQDSSACTGNTILAEDGTSVDAGGNSCWTFAAPEALISSAENQTFAQGNDSTSISTITITDHGTPQITAANDIRIKIATSSVRMLWDTSDTAAVFGGTASGKVSNPISYEGGGSVLVIPVDSNFSGGDTLTISGLSFTNFTATNTATTALALYTDGANDTASNNLDTKTVTITGSLVLSNHSAGQVSDSFTFETDTEVVLYRLRLAPAGETVTVSSFILPLTGINGVIQSDLTNVKLYRDMNSDGLYDANDVQIGGAGAVAITGQSGTITFSGSWSATTTVDYLVIGDITNIRAGDHIRAALTGSNITATGDQMGTSMVIRGTVSSVQHIKNGLSGGGAVGGDAPAGVIRGGGGASGGGEVDTNTGGTSLTDAVGYEAPGSTGSPQNEWTGGADGYDSDGAYATAAASNLRQSYGAFGFSIPGSNQITGIEVKLEAAGSSAAGNVEVALSWNGGSNSTAKKTTSTLTATDSVYTLGGPSDIWGRSWSPSEFTDGNFTLEVTAQPDGNTVKIDAIRVRVYHQATGGGGGGGGEVLVPTHRFFAGAPTMDVSEQAVLNALAWVLWKVVFM